MPNSLFNVNKVASALDCSRASVWRYAKNDPNFPRPIKVGHLTRWRESDIADFIEQAANAA